MNKTVALIFILMSLTAALTIEVPPVNSSPKTVTVPDDYPTIAAAVGNATSGDTVFVKKGTYEEHSLVINKTILLTGEDAKTTIIKNIDSPFWDGGDFLPPPPVAVQISSNDIRFSGFTVNGVYASYIPINVTANRTQIIGNIISPSGAGISLSGNNNAITQNNIIGRGNGYLSCAGSYNIIVDNNITGRASGDLNIDGSLNIVYNNTVTDCDEYGGISINGPENIVANNTLNKSAGVHIESGSRNIILKNVITNGGGIGVYSGYNNTLCANHIANCGTGVIIASSQSGISYNYSGALTGYNLVYHNNIIGNRRQVNRDWVVYGIDSYDNGKQGNYWSDYNGTDANGDGIGDTPYIIDTNRADNFPLIAPFDVDSVVVVLPEQVNLSPSPTTSPTPTLAPSPSPIHETSSSSATSKMPSPSSTYPTLSFSPSNPLQSTSTPEVVAGSPFPEVEVVIVVSLVAVSVLAVAYFAKKKYTRGLNY